MNSAKKHGGNAESATTVWYNASKIMVTLEPGIVIDRPIDTIPSVVVLPLLSHTNCVELQVEWNADMAQCFCTATVSLPIELSYGTDRASIDSSRTAVCALSHASIVARATGAEEERKSSTPPQS